MGTPYTFVRQTSIVASAARIFPRIEDFRAWRAWSPWRQLDPGVREYGAPSFGVGAHYRWSGNREAGAGSMAQTHSGPPRQHSDPPRKIEIDLVFVKPFPNRSRIEFVLDEKRGQASGEWRPHGEFTGAMRFFRLFFNMDKAVGRDLERASNACGRQSNRTKRSVAPEGPSERDERLKFIDGGKALLSSTAWTGTLRTGRRTPPARSRRLARSASTRPRRG